MYPHPGSGLSGKVPGCSSGNQWSDNQCLAEMQLACAMYPLPLSTRMKADQGWLQVAHNAPPQDEVEPRLVARCLAMYPPLGKFIVSIKVIATLDLGNVPPPSPKKIQSWTSGHSGIIDHWKVVLHVYDTFYGFCHVPYTAITCKVTKNDAKYTKIKTDTP